MSCYSVLESLLLGTVFRDTRHASWVIIRHRPCGSLAWDFSFVLIG